MNLKNTTNIFIVVLLLAYTLLTIVCINNPYFWDTIQQVSKEGHWFYINNFSSLIAPAYNSNIELANTGYHPPLIGIITAFLWKTVGLHLWVSHVFVFLWLLVLIFNTVKIGRLFLSEKHVGFFLLVALLEPTVLTQFAIASPDFILLTAFVLSIRAVLERKYVLLSLSVFILCSINMRGIFIGALLFFCHTTFVLLQTNSKLRIKTIISILKCYLPTFFILLLYFGYYFKINGWFFSQSTENSHYSLPTNFVTIAKHLGEFVLRSIENGRIIMWGLLIFTAYLAFKTKSTLSQNTKFILLFFLLLNGLYFTFVFISQMPFSARYFMPQFFLLTILVFWGIEKFFSTQKTMLVVLLILGFELTGNFWIYPDKTAKSWESTLAHIPFYDLREQCFNYIDNEKLNYKDISSGFCLYGDRGYIELKNYGKTVGSENKTKYYIYSNISNLSDAFQDELRDVKIWRPIKKFSKAYVTIIIYQRCDFYKSKNT